MPYANPADRAAASRRYYARNREVVIARVAPRRIEIRRRNVEYLRDYKAGRPCTDCGVVYPPYVMQFDHVGDDKTDHVSKMAYDGVSLATLDTEIAKCELVCANCHFERTHQRRLALGKPEPDDVPPAGFEPASKH